MLITLIRGQNPAPCTVWVRGGHCSRNPVLVLSFLLNCPPVQAARRLVRHVARRPAARRAGLGSAAPRAARRAASLTPAIKLGGLACLLGPALLPSPAMGPMDTPAALQRAAPAGPGLAGLGQGLPGAALGDDALAGAAPGGVLGGGPALLLAAAGLTELERSVLPEAEAPPATPARPVVVSEPASMGLFAVGLGALAWLRRRGSRRRPSGGRG